jgi:hypothetical protein
MQPPADRVVDPDGPATDAASTPTDGSAASDPGSIAGWTPPPWTSRPDAPAGWTPPPWTAGPDAPAGSPLYAADTQPFWRRSLEPILVVIGCAVLIGIGIFFAATDDDYWSPEVAPAEPTQVRTEVATPEEIDEIDEIDEDLNWDEYNIDDSVDLRVGDCFDLKDPSADQIEHVKAVPCTTEHEFEVFYVGAMDKGSRPTDHAFETYVMQNCNPAFGAYIGKAYKDSDLDYIWLVPTEDAWRSGDRTVQCAVNDPRIYSLARSLRGTQQ